MDNMYKESKVKNKKLAFILFTTGFLLFLIILFGEITCRIFFNRNIRPPYYYNQKPRFAKQTVIVTAPPVIQTVIVIVTATYTDTPTPSITPTPSETPTSSPTATDTETLTPTPTETPTDTPTPIGT